MASVKLYGKKNLRTAAYNRAAARFFLNMAEDQLEGQFYSAQASIVFSAFTHEAFVNTLGAKVLKDWKQHEFKSTYKKVELICEKIGYQPNLKKRPYSTVKKLFEFRNLIAHGREETIKVEGILVPKKEKGGYLDAIEGKWEKYCTVRNARQAYEDVHAIASDLCEKSKVNNFPGFPFGSPASGFFRVEEDDT